MVQWKAGADRVYVFLDVVCVVPEIDPRLAIGCIAQSVVDVGYLRRAVQVCNVVTEVEEVRTID